MAYFDNAATTFPKPSSVYDAMDSFARNCGGSVGRGNHTKSVNAAAVVAETRSMIQQLLHCRSKQVIFTPTATLALNMILLGSIQAGVKNVYITPFEHNAVTRVLHHLEQTAGISVYTLPVKADLTFDIDTIRVQFTRNKPDLLVMSHVSNVIGIVTPVEEICKIAKMFDSLTVIDMAQSAGLIDINVGLSCFDFAVFAGHKTLYGPTGISGFVMNPSVQLSPILFGGTGYDSANQDMPESLPEKYEMGTLNTCAISGLNASLRWINSTTIEAIHAKEIENREKLINILSSYDFIHVIGVTPSCEYTGIVSCTIDGISSDSVGTIFSDANVQVRTGLQCAPHAHKFLHTFPAGTVRFSVSYFTSEEDFSTLQTALDYIENNI